MSGAKLAAASRKVTEKWLHAIASTKLGDFYQSPLSKSCPEASQPYTIKPQPCLNRRSISDTATAKLPTRQSFIPCTGEDKTGIVMVYRVLRRAPSRSSTCTWTATCRPRTWQLRKDRKACRAFRCRGSTRSRPQRANCPMLLTTTPEN